MLFPSGPRNTPKEAAHSVSMCYRQKQCHIHALFSEIRYEKLKLRSLPKRSLKAESLKGKNQNRWVPNWVRSKHADPLSHVPSLVGPHSRPSVTSNLSAELDVTQFVTALTFASEIQALIVLGQSHTAKEWNFA